MFNENIVLIINIFFFFLIVNTYLEIDGHYSFHHFPIHNLLRSTNKFDSVRLIEKKIPIGSWGGEFGLKVKNIFIYSLSYLKIIIKLIENFLLF